MHLPSAPHAATRDGLNCLGGGDKETRFIGLWQAAIISGTVGKVPSTFAPIVYALHAQFVLQCDRGRWQPVFSPPSFAARLAAYKCEVARTILAKVLDRADPDVVLAGSAAHVARREEKSWEKANRHKAYKYPENIIFTTVTLPSDYLAQVRQLPSPYVRHARHLYVVLAMCEHSLTCARIGRGRHIVTEIIPRREVSYETLD